MARVIPGLYFRLGGSKVADGTPISRQVMMAALERLDAKLGENGLKIKMWLIGGGAMMLHLDAREHTEDLDVVPRAGNFREVKSLAEAVAKEVPGLHSEWINADFSEQIRSMHIGPRDFEADPRYRWANMEIQFASAPLLLALKCFSARDKDAADLALLMARVKLPTIDALYDLLERYEPDYLPDDEQMYFIEGIFKEVRGR
jgi:hypothetical protein